MWKDFLSLIYPNSCPGCNDVLLKNEVGICTVCLSELPKTNYYKDHANPVAKLFWGRIPLEIAVSVYYYSKESKVQKLIHALKYSGKTKIGEILGVELGKEVLKHSKYSKVDLIIPIPLFKKKEKTRGYNQSFFIAKGVARILKAPIENNILIKKIPSATQTDKSRFERWNNINEHFALRNNKSLENTHVLLVDDVVTTGSTIEACSNAFKGIQGVKLSVATLAKA